MSLGHGGNGPRLIQARATLWSKGLSRTDAQTVAEIAPPRGVSPEPSGTAQQNNNPCASERGRCESRSRRQSSVGPPRPVWVAVPVRATVPMLKVEQVNPRRAHAMPFGAHLQSDGTVRFRLWAPSHRKIQIQLDGPTNLDMQAEHGGWHELVTDRARAGTLYQLVLPD